MTTTPQQASLVLTEEQIDAICAPGRAERWKGDGRQYDRDTVRLVLEALAASGEAALVPDVRKMGAQPITEEMHVAACKVLTRASGLDGLPQRMLDAMLAAAPKAPASAEVAPVQRNDPLSALAIRLLVGNGDVSQERADAAFRVACEAVEDEARRMDIDLPWVSARAASAGKQAPEAASPSQQRDLSNDAIREVFLANGFTVKEGQTDLKPYVFAAARALLARAAQHQPKGTVPPARSMDDATTDAAIHYTAGWNACREAMDQAPAPAPADPWREAVDQQLILCELTVSNFLTPADAVRGLLDWHAMAAREAGSASPAEGDGHIKHPYTLAELRAKIASHDYSAELLLQHAMLLLDRLSPAEGDAEALAQALEFYSDPADYKAPFTGGMGALYFDCGAKARDALAAHRAAPKVQPKGTTAERLLAQVRETCAASLRAGPGVAVTLPAELAEEGRKFMRGEASLIEQLPFADVQKLGDLLNETPTTQAPAPAPATGDTNGRRVGLRPAVHGRVLVGSYTPGALADLLFASRDVMSLNAEMGLTMDQLLRLTQAVLTAVPSPAVAPTQETPAGYKLLEDGKTMIPEDWTPLRLEWEPGYPEDVAFGPQFMMDRLKKWLDRHFANLVAAKSPTQETPNAAPTAKQEVDHD